MGKLPDQTAAKKHELQEPIRLFDDFFYAGDLYEGSWILKTEEGLVLIDTTKFEDEYERYLIPGLKKLGLENEKIRCVLLTHGHFDHCGGAAMIQDKTGCDVALSMEDTAYMTSAYENTGKNAFKPPQVTMYLQDGQDLVFGKHTVRVMMAPGHTPGCLHFSAEVHEGNETHRFVMMGGYGIFGPGRYPDGDYPYGVLWGERYALLFANSCVELWEYAKKTGADIFLNPHPHLCDAFKHAEENKNRKPGDANAFVIGTEGVRQWIAERYDACLESAQFFTDIRETYQG